MSRTVRSVAAAVVTVGVVLSLGACALLGRGSFADPVVDLRSVTITGLGLTGGSLEVELSVYNPNRFSLDALGLTYQVDVDSVRLGSGALDKRYVVAANDTSIVRVPVSFTYVGLGVAGRGLIESGAVNYRVRGDVTVGTPLGNFTRPYDRSGRFTNVPGARR
jgi:LEA14-like dessication related protein